MHFPQVCTSHFHVEDDTSKKNCEMTIHLSYDEVSALFCAAVKGAEYTLFEIQVAFLETFTFTV